MSSWEINRYSYGFGISRMRANIPAETQSFWDSTLDTRNPRQVILPPLMVQCSISPSASISAEILSADPNNVFIFCQPTVNVLYHYKLAGDTFGSLGLISMPNLMQAERFDWLDTENQWGVVWSNMAADGTNRKYTGFKTATVNAGGTAPAFAALDALGSQAWFSPFVANSDGIARYGYQNVVDKAGGLCVTTATIPSIVASRSEPEARAAYQALTGDGNFVAYSDGIFDASLSNGNLRRKVDFSQQRQKNVGKPLGVFDSDNLMIPVRIGMKAYDTGDDTIRDIGLDLDDGLPSDKSGEITAMASGDIYLFAATKPKTATDKASIFAWDRVGWHYMAQIPSVNVQVGIMRNTSRPDSFDRLFILPTMTLSAITATVGVIGTFSKAYPPLYLPLPQSNPLTEASYTFATTGKLVYPENDLGLPEYNKGFYDISVDGRALGAGNQIEVFYGLDGVAPSTSAGICTVSGVRQLKLGTIGQGVSGKRIQVVPVLTRGTAPGTTPQLTSLMLHYLAYPAVREAFNFVIDIDQTARPGGRPAQTIIDEIGSLFELSTLVPFYFGHIGTRLVKVTNPKVSEEEEQADNWYASELQGAIKLRVVELL